jgi:stage V sporulation protein S
VSVDVLKVSSKSNPNSVAGALAGVVRSSGSVEVQVVGAGALNQAVKAIAIARGYVATTGLDLMCRPTFADIRIDGESRTAIRLHIEICAPGPAPAAAPSATDGSGDTAAAAADKPVASLLAADESVASVPAPAGPGVSPGPAGWGP